MYSNIVKDLYIGKSKLIFEANDCIIPDVTEIGKIFFPTGWEGNLPDYGTMGNLWVHNNQGTFEITWKRPEHKIWVTGIPKGAILDDFRIQETIWSSYYEDNIRGYLFQITDYLITKPKLINDGSN